MTHSYLQLTEEEKNLFDLGAEHNQDGLFSDIKSYADLQERINYQLDNYTMSELIIHMLSEDALIELLKANTFTQMLNKDLVNVREELGYQLADFVITLKQDFYLNEAQEIIKEELKERGN